MAEGFPAETEGIYESLPESVVSSVLSRWGYQDTEASTDPEPLADPPATPDPEPVTPEPPATGEPAAEPEPQEQPVPAETPPPTDDEEVSEIPAPGGPIWQPTPEAPSGATPDTPLPVATPEPDPVTSRLIAEITALRAEVAATRAQPPQPSPTFPQQPVLPQFTEDDLENPAVRALVLIANQQYQQLNGLSQQVAATQQSVTQARHTESAEVANAATTTFARNYNLPEELMSEIRTNVVGHDVTEYMEKVAPDPYKAAEFALTRAYWNTPAARTFEFERQAENRAKTQSRKQKLAGVGGSSGSAPRTPQAPDTSTAEGRKAAAVAEVTAAMFGDQ